MNRIITIFSLLSLIAAMSGCYYDKEDVLYPPNCDVSNVTFTGTIKPLIQQRCALSGCHVSGGQSPDLSSNTVIAQQQDRIRARAVDHNPSPMPQAGPLPACEIQQLKAWLDAGASITD